MTQLRTFRHSAGTRAIAAAVLIGLIALWGISWRYVLYAGAGGGAGSSRTGLALASGAIVFQYWDSLPTESHAKVGAVPLNQTLYQRSGMCWLPFHEQTRLVGSMWHVPLWFLVLPAGFFVWRAWRRKFVPGLCGSCGYDKSGLLGDTCPECGTLLFTWLFASFTSQPG